MLWFNQHLYPSVAVSEEAGLRYLEAASFEESTDISAFGLAAAQIHAIANPDQAEPALRYLERAAAEGSIYALHALSAVFGAYAQKTGSEIDRINAAAYSRAAELQGDWMAGFFRLMEFTPVEGMLAQLKALQLLEDLDAYRASRGLAPLQRSMRPRLDELLERVDERMAEDGLQALFEEP